MLPVNYVDLGLKVGLEIHQQLETSQKLFCPCVSEISSEEPCFKFYRRLRPTQSELGEIDPAAAFEYKKRKGFTYEGDEETSCLVEMDEEPPHNLNSEAIDLCMTVALMVGAKPIDEIHVMRKIVIDGSNTTGFQRTCVIALGGKISIKGKGVSIQTISLEEDAARKISEKESGRSYRIDRLCIPLIEIATSPEIYTPKDAGQTALAIGQILRATKRVKRGLGTIRQDLNISIRGGGLVEIKGVQDLSLIPKVVENEVNRQLSLLKIRDMLKEKGVKEQDFKREFFDVTQIFRHTKCKLIKKALDNRQNVFAVTLPLFKGLMKIELEPGVRFATELADYAKFWGQVGGIFHTDELPGYGVSEDEVSSLIQVLNAKEDDIVVITVGDEENSRDALSSVLERAKKAIAGVPSETRGANMDGSTHYSRPRPGSARMYPETDVPPVPISKERIQNLKLNLPPLPDVAIKNLMEKYNLNNKLATQLQSSDYLDVFEKVTNETSVTTSFVAATLTETLINLKREDVAIDNITNDHILNTFRFVDEGKIVKEAISDIFSWLSKHENSEVQEAVKTLKLEPLSEIQIKTLVDKILEEKKELIKKRGIKSLTPLMGLFMSRHRGKADPKSVQFILSNKLKDVAN